MEALMSEPLNLTKVKSSKISKIYNKTKISN